MIELAVEADPFDVRRVAPRAGAAARRSTPPACSRPPTSTSRCGSPRWPAEADARVVLAAALAVRAPRLGHVYVDLAGIRETAAVDTDEPVDLRALPWPAAAVWTRRVEASALVAVGEEAPARDRPLRLVGTWLYLDRYWREERRIAADLEAFGAGAPEGVRSDVLADGLARLFGGEADAGQRRAAATAVRRRFAVIAGGPGTGKTTTVARIVALLGEQAAAAGAPPPLVALAAPTGKAAARLQEAVHEQAAGLAVDAAIRGPLLALEASTLHRLLGWRPGSHSRFRHHAATGCPTTSSSSTRPRWSRSR